MSDSQPHSLAEKPADASAMPADNHGDGFWRVSAGRLVRVLDANGDVICGVHRVGRYQGRRSEAAIEAATIAKAQLIAAAPRLLAAAQTVLAGLNNRIETALPSRVPVFDGIAELHSAVAEATGAAS